MVVKIVWVNSWLAVIISLSVLLGLLLFIFLCLCWQRRLSRSVDQLYILDEEGLKRADKVPNPIDGSPGFFRKFSNTGLLKTNFRFSSCDYSIAKNCASYERANLITADRELMDSWDIDKRFNDSVLKIDNDKDCLTVEQVEEDARSCTSLDSCCTFYSVYPTTRANSMSETMKSASSEPENLEKY